MSKLVIRNGDNIREIINFNPAFIEGELSSLKDTITTTLPTLATKAEAGIRTLTYDQTTRNLRATNHNDSYDYVNLPLAATNRDGLMSASHLSKLYDLDSQVESIVSGGQARNKYATHSEMVSMIPNFPAVDGLGWNEHDWVTVVADEN